MGTNYYMLCNKCPTCGHVREREHIGKSSFGWTFTFHATDTIRSAKEWFAELEKPDTTIVDEYGDTISAAEFRRMVEHKSTASSNHAKECAHIDGSYLDDEGNSMSPGEFS